MHRPATIGIHSFNSCFRVKTGKKRKKTSKPSQSFLVRPPGDYPWVCISHLKDDLAHLVPSDLTDRVERIIRSRDRNKLEELGRDWSLQCIAPVVRPAERVVYSFKLGMSNLIRKFQFSGDSATRKQIAIQNVLQAEHDCRLFNRKGYKRLMDPDSGKPSQFLKYMQSFCFQVLGPLDGDKVRHWTRHGPGSSTQTSRGLVSKYFKYSDWPYHVSSRAISSARRLIESDPRWHGALEDSYRKRYGIEKYQVLNIKEFWENVFTIQDWNKISTVPKDGRKDRPIAIEPTINVMLQLGVDGFIRKRLLRWGIDINSQEKNRYLAMRGSIRTDAESPCTIDLSNASDTISLRLVKLLFTKEWYDYLCDLRAPKGVLPGGDSLRYAKISSMGNGYTFAIETLVFAAIAYAASKYTYGRWMRDDISIFGDDIIVPEAMGKLTVMLLEACGLTVNQDKSFLKGSVKESCGFDYVSGHMVRTVYLDTMPVDQRGVLCDRNRIHRWVELHFGVETPKLDQFFMSLLGPDFKQFGPYSDIEFDSYWHVSTSPTKYIIKPVRPDGVGSVYEFGCIGTRPLGINGCNDFLFRKLMHSLRPAEEVLDCLDLFQKKIKSSGSVFSVTKRYAEDLVVRKRVTSIWRDSYSMPKPDWSAQ